MHFLEGHFQSHFIVQFGQSYNNKQKHLGGKKTLKTLDVVKYFQTFESYAAPQEKHNFSMMGHRTLSSI